MADKYIELEKEQLDLTPQNEFTDTQTVTSNTDWWVDGYDYQGKKQLYDKFGNPLYDGAIIELGDVSMNFYHIASLFPISLPCVIQLSTDALSFFAIEDEQLIIQDYKGLELDLTDRIIPIVFVPTRQGEFEMQVIVQFFDGEVWTLTITATSVVVDERLKVMMSNFGHDYLEAYNKAMLTVDNRQDLINNIVQNEKIREWLIRRDDIDSRLGTYSGLLNALDWLGYTNSVTLYEVLKNALGIRQLVELAENIEQYAKTFMRTNLLMLVYAYNYVSTEYCTKCTAMPIIKMSDTLPDQDTLKKLQNLIYVLEYDFLPEHIHIADLQCDIFVAYIAMHRYGTQTSQVHTNKPQLPGVRVNINDVSAFASTEAEDGSIKAYIRPHTMLIDGPDMQSPFTEPNSVFVVQQTPVNIDLLNAQEYIDWFIDIYVNKIPRYLNFTKSQVDLTPGNQFKDDIGVLSNTDWSLLETMGLDALFNITNVKTSTQNRFDNNTPIYKIDSN